MPGRENLDDRSYRALLEQAVARAGELCPAWTDRNAHDPGVMLLELLSWLKEAQQYHLNRAGSARGFFPLLGVTRREARAAEAVLRLPPVGDGERLFLPAGLPVMAGEVRFETAEVFRPEARRVTAVSARGETWPIERAEVFYPFGRTPQAGAQCSLFLDRPLVPGEEAVLSLSVGEPDVPPRNPIDPENPPELARIVWEYRAAGGFLPLAVRDETFGLLCGGQLRITANRPMAPDSSGRWELRGTLAWHAYDIPPRVTGFLPAELRAVQRHTLCEDVLCTPQGRVLRADTFLAATGVRMLFYEREPGVYTRVPDRMDGADERGGVFTLPAPPECPVRVVSCARDYLPRRVLGAADGAPNRRFAVELRGQRVCDGALSVLVAEDGGLERAERWEQVADFHCSGPTDRHFTFDPAQGEVVFGDGLRGAMPRGVILLAALSLTRGAAGNIAAGQLTEAEWNGRVLPLLQPAPASGGGEAETDAEVIARARARTLRAVTGEDFTTLAKGTPGLLIDRVTAYPLSRADGDPCHGGVAVVVKPFGGQVPLSEAYRRHIRAYLEPFRLAGTELVVLSPEYVRIHVAAALRCIPGPRDPAYAARACLRAYLDPSVLGFGARITPESLSRLLAESEGVEEVCALSLSAAGGRAALDRHGGLSLAPGALPCAGELEIQVL